MIMFFFFLEELLVYNYILKGNSASFAHQSEIAGLSSTGYLKKRCTKPFMDPEEAACDLIHCLALILH